MRSVEDANELAKLTDPWQRLQQAHELVIEMSDAITDATRIRREAMDDIINGVGCDPGRDADIAARLGVSRQRVGQLRRSGPRPERAFLGSGGTLTVAFGGKLEGGKTADEAGQVISSESLRGYELLVETGKDLGFTVNYEVIEPPGLIDLSRPSLIVACGPRLSPIIEQALGADRATGFAHDDLGWHIRDYVTGVDHRSPMDDDKPQNADIGYIARLPRIDGRGTYLYAAGIHAPGIAIGLHYIVENIAELYSQLRARRFSALVRGTFDPSTRKVTGSELIAGPYRPDGSGTW